MSAFERTLNLVSYRIEFGLRLKPGVDVRDVNFWRLRVSEGTCLTFEQCSVYHESTCTIALCDLEGCACTVHTPSRSQLS